MKLQKAQHDLLNAFVLLDYTKATRSREIKSAEEARIELGRPLHVKPLASAMQKQPEIVREKDMYTVHPVGLAVGKNQQLVYGIAVVDGMTLPEAFEEIIVGFVRDTAEQLAKQQRDLIKHAH